MDSDTALKSLATAPNLDTQEITPSQNNESFFEHPVLSKPYRWPKLRTFIAPLYHVVTDIGNREALEVVLILISEEYLDRPWPFETSISHDLPNLKQLKMSFGDARPDQYTTIHDVRLCSSYVDHVLQIFARSSSLSTISIVFTDSSDIRASRAAPLLPDARFREFF